MSYTADALVHGPLERLVRRHGMILKMATISQTPPNTQTATQIAANAVHSQLINVIALA